MVVGLFCTWCERVVMVVGLFCTWCKGVSICVNHCECVLNMLQMLWTSCRDRKIFISTTSSQQVHDSYAGINLTGYHPPPPRADRRATNFSIKIPTPGTAFQCKTPAPGSKKRNKNPHPWAYLA